MVFAKFITNIVTKKQILKDDPDIRYKFALYYFFTIVSKLSELNKFSNITQRGEFLTLSENEKITLRKEILDDAFKIRFPRFSSKRLSLSHSTDITHFGLKEYKDVWNKLCGGIFFLSRIELEATSFTEHKLLRGMDLEATEPITGIALKNVWLNAVIDFFQTENFKMNHPDWYRFEELKEVYGYLKKIL